MGNDLLLVREERKEVGLSPYALELPTGVGLILAGVVADHVDLQATVGHLPPLCGELRPSIA